MSATIGGIANYGTLGRLIDDSASTRAKLNTLTQQEATGRIGDSYAALGQGARVSLDLRPAMAHATTLQDNIDAATGRMQVTQTAMTQIQSIASTLFAQLNTLNSLSAEGVDTTAAAARQALQDVAGILNSRNGDVYVFAGQDTTNPPVPDPDQILASGFYTQINAAVAGLGASAGAVTSATLGCRRLERRRHLAVLRQPVAARRRDPDRDGGGRPGPASTGRVAGERQHAGRPRAAARPPARTCAT